MEDLISVIVPVYNSEEYISSCVESVLAQFYGSSWVMVGKKYPQPQCLC